MVVTLYYFDARGLMEPIRMILAYGGEKFEEVRVPLTSIPGVLPPEVKTRTTWGTVPFAEFDGKKLNQSLAITRFFARKHNLVPKDEYEAALCDEYIDTCKDLMSVWYPVLFEKDESKKKELLKEVMQKSKEKYLTIFNSIVEKNDGKHLVGKTLTWADIFVAHALDNTVQVLGVSLVDDFPGLKSLCENVYSTPSIKAWVDKRPKTQF